MLQDVVMVLLAIPISLALSQSNLSFDPFAAPGLAIWAIVIAFCHVLFRTFGLYNTVWRFASTPDFFNIIKSCAAMTVALYLTALTVRAFHPVVGLNERQFIVFFLVTFTIISAPRLFYRFFREGDSWRRLKRSGNERHARTALFLGALGEADLVIRSARSEHPTDMTIVGILAIEDDVPAGSKLQGVPVVADRPRLAAVLEEYGKGTRSLDLLIVGNGAEHNRSEFSELVRVARGYGITVVQFAGMTSGGQGGKLVLEAVEMETILRRPAVASDIERIGAFMSRKRVLITGGAGSIGRTMVRRALELGADTVIVADNSEFGIFQLNQTISPLDRDRVICRIVDVLDRSQFSRIVEETRPDIMFHAAALKHVPLLEENWESAIKTNVFGTLNCAEIAAEQNVREFVLISSDKAVDPSSMLGQTKRLAEQIVSAMHLKKVVEGNGHGPSTIFGSVRFGNVFGSDGSVATIFRKQIERGGPVTITDSRMMRYLMTTGEAVDLVLMSATDATTRRGPEGFGVYMLDMGEPVPILEVAETMIRMAGKTPYHDIAIEFTGIRPGEKLNERLSADGEEILQLGITKIFGLRTHVASFEDVSRVLPDLARAVEMHDKAAAIAVMESIHAMREAIHVPDELVLADAVPQGASVN